MHGQWCPAPVPGCSCWPMAGLAALIREVSHVQCPSWRPLSPPARCRFHTCQECHKGVWGGWGWGRQEGCAASLSITSPSRSEQVYVQSYWGTPLLGGSSHSFAQGLRKWCCPYLGSRQALQALPLSGRARPLMGAPSLLPSSMRACAHPPTLAVRHSPGHQEGCGVPSQPS